MYFQLKSKIIHFMKFSGQNVSKTNGTFETENPDNGAKFDVFPQQMVG